MNGKLAKVNVQQLSIWLVVLVIAAACLMMAGPMQAALPGAGEFAARQGLMQQQLLWWRCGWGLWMASALGLLWFAQLLYQRATGSPLARMGLTLVALGTVPDLSAETLYAWLIPELDVQAAAVLEQVAVQLTGFLGNGLYNLGGLLLTLALWRAQQAGAAIGLCRSSLLLGCTAWLLGLGLSAAVAAKDWQAAQWLTASSMMLSTFWMAWLSVSVFRDRISAR